MSRITFLWRHLPDYAARLIRATIDRGHQVDVIATRPYVPIEGMERSLGQRAHWIKDTTDTSFAALGLTVPDLVFQGGYHVPAFNRLAADARAAGGQVVLMADNSARPTWRQRTVDPVRHRLAFVPRFAGIFVPGASGQRFARAMGYDPDRTVTGFYGADPSVFGDGGPLETRPRRLLFVGQFVARKNVLGLAEAFARVAARHPGWSLVMCGSGPQREAIPAHPQIEVRGFVQPEALTGILRESRALVLPSLCDHWGLSVHEAALSGCALALSDGVGAADDFATPANAVRFAAGDTGALAGALDALMGWDEAAWQVARPVSLALARRFGPERFADGVERLLAVATAGMGEDAALLRGSARPAIAPVPRRPTPGTPDFAA
ncbi:glycosyltransferase family 4 protein [Acuticoccus sp. I52.16.1]|uniref:glycosyltransferase family 4 protein n=1 Tax=Acuticoccus sp. I52.16.1 TaxID=2928472 RepID=UPI001FD101EE|nr:glycosyltransferase family 4 protein [Acuticoccus sp. I52.16.1]UOM37218.1 glycosyltransferase family 4 protein [Acuticoccus sp. I52.16.1]